jgi:hypothetical protein
LEFQILFDPSSISAANLLESNFKSFSSLQYSFSAFNPNSIAQPIFFSFILYRTGPNAFGLHGTNRPISASPQFSPSKAYLPVVFQLQPSAAALRHQAAKATPPRFPFRRPISGPTQMSFNSRNRRVEDTLAGQ